MIVSRINSLAMQPRTNDRPERESLADCNNNSFLFYREDGTGWNSDLDGHGQGQAMGLTVK